MTRFPRCGATMAFVRHRGLQQRYNPQGRAASNRGHGRDGSVIASRDPRTPPARIAGSTSRFRHRNLTSAASLPARARPRRSSLGTTPRWAAPGGHARMAKAFAGKQRVAPSKQRPLLLGPKSEASDRRGRCSNFGKPTAKLTDTTKAARPPRRCSTPSAPGRSPSTVSDELLSSKRTSSSLSGTARTAVSGVDEQYASRHSAWLHCPARDCRRSCRVVRGFAVRAAAASARAWRRLPARHRSPWMQWRALPCPARSLSAEHDRQATERWRRSFRFRGNGGGPIRRPTGIASSSAGAGVLNAGGQLPVRRQPYKSEGQPVDRDDDHPIRADARSRRSARTSGRAWAVSPGADHIAIAKPSASPPRSRSRRRSPPTQGGRSRPAGPSTAEANVPARAGELAQYAADGVPRARSHVTAARTKERFLASQVTARGPHCGPMEHPDRAGPPAARS